MKKIFVALCMVAFLAACDDSASAENNEPTTLSSAEKYGSSSSSRHCEECNDEAISSDSNAESNGSSRSSSSEQNVASSSSEKLSETSSSSADKMESSSNSEFLATPCKTETEDNCEYGTVLDDRDGQTYKTVKIGTQTWMAENLNYADSVTTASLKGKSWCYNDVASNCSKYGRLYTWAAAKTVCPSGWHLPSTTEFKTLFTAVGGSSTAGTVLKSTGGWYNDGNGTDAFGFSALPAGNRRNNGYYNDEGNYAYFWSSKEYDSSNAYRMYLYYNHDNAYLSYCSKDYGFSVRCVKD